MRVGPISGGRYKQTWWIRFGQLGWGLQCLGPEHRPLFSERNGYKKPFLRMRGRRYFALHRVRRAA